MIIKYLSLSSAVLLAGLVFLSPVNADEQRQLKQMSNQPILTQAVVQPIACPIDLIVSVPSHHDTFANYTMPNGGWSDYTVPGGYQGVRLRRLRHKVEFGQMRCFYGLLGLSAGGLTFEAIEKPVPAGKTCTTGSNYTFDCKQ